MKKIIGFILVLGVSFCVIDAVLIFNFVNMLGKM